MIGAAHSNKISIYVDSEVVTSVLVADIANITDVIHLVEYERGEVTTFITVSADTAARPSLTDEFTNEVLQDILNRLRLLEGFLTNPSDLFATI